MFRCVTRRGLIRLAHHGLHDLFGVYSGGYWRKQPMPDLHFRSETTHTVHPPPPRPLLDEAGKLPHSKWFCRLVEDPAGEFSPTILGKSATSRIKKNGPQMSEALTTQDLLSLFRLSPLIGGADPACPEPRILRFGAICQSSPSDRVSGKDRRYFANAPRFGLSGDTRHALAISSLPTINNSAVQNPRSQHGPFRVSYSLVRPTT
jgi:hypothetical protein